VRDVSTSFVAELSSGKKFILSHGRKFKWKTLLLSLEVIISLKFFDELSDAILSYRTSKENAKIILTGYL
jgi:hypothetical protein